MIQSLLYMSFIWVVTSPKTNMDTQNDDLEQVGSIKTWPFLVSILDFWGFKHYHWGLKWW